MRVAGRRGRISRTIPAGAAQITSPIRKTTAWSAGELAISIKETKIAQRLRQGNKFFATCYNQCISQIRRPLGTEIQWCSAHRVAECQSGSVKGLARRRPLQQFGPPPSHTGDPPAAAAGIDRVSDDGVPDMLQMHPDLMGPAGVKLQPE